MARAQVRQLGASYRLLMFGFGLSTIGTGLVLPFTAIFITTQLKLGAGLAAAYFATTGGAALALGLIAGQLIDRIGPRPLGTSGTIALAVGYILLAESHSTMTVLASAVVVGAGNGFYQPSFTPIVTSLVSDEMRRRAFALRHLVQNAGLGVGALLGGLLADQAGAFRWLFIGNGLTYLPFALALWICGSIQARSCRSDRVAVKVSYRRLLAMRPIVLLVFIQFCVPALGYAQFNASVPLLMRERMAESPRLVGLIFVVNTIAVIVLQYPLAAFFERFSESTTLLSISLFWVLAFLSGGCAALETGQLRITLLLGFPMLFAAGEAAYSSSFYSLLTTVAEGNGPGRVNALASLAYNLGNLSGPALGIALIADHAAPGAWLVLTVPLVLPMAAAILLRRMLVYSPTHAVSPD